MGLGTDILGSLLEGLADVLLPEFIDRYAHTRAGRIVLWCFGLMVLAGLIWLVGWLAGWW